MTTPTSATPQHVQRRPGVWARLVLLPITTFVLLSWSPPVSAATAEPSTPITSKTIRYCSAMNAPPMEFMSASGKPEGLDVDLGDTLARRAGLRPVWINMTFAGLIPSLLAGHCDAIISQLFIKPGRLKVIDEIPYMMSNEAVMIRTGAPKANSLAAYSGQKVATVVGTTETILLQQANARLAAAHKTPIDIVAFPDNTQAMQQLELHEVAAYCVTYETGRYYQLKQPKVFALAGPPFAPILTGIGLRKDETALENTLRLQLTTIKKSGAYDAIFRRWGLKLDELRQTK